MYPMQAIDRTSSYDMNSNFGCRSRGVKKSIPSRGSTSAIRALMKNLSCLLLIFGMALSSANAQKPSTPAVTGIGYLAPLAGSTFPASRSEVPYLGIAMSGGTELNWHVLAATGLWSQSGWPRGSGIEITDFTLNTKEIHPLLGPDIEGTFTINGAATVTMQIRREKDDLLVYEESDVFPGSGEYPFLWDGRDDLGNIVSTGLYRIVLIADDGVDDFTYDPGVPPGGGHVSGSVPASYDPFRNEFYKIQVTMQSRGLLSMEITPSDGPVFYNFQDAYYPSGQSWVYWDGRDSSGEIIELADNVSRNIYYPTPGNIRPTAIHVLSTAPRIRGLEEPPDIEVKSDPYLIWHSYEQISNIWYRIDQDSYITVKMLPPGIYDPKHGAAITLVDNELKQAVDGNGDPIDHLVEWVGYINSDPNDILTEAEGAFTFTIKAEEEITEKSSLYRGVLNIRR